jgi:hypothetical protein
MIYTWFTGKNYYKLAVEKDRDSIFTTVTTYENHAGISFIECDVQYPFCKIPFLSSGI